MNEEIMRLFTRQIGYIGAPYLLVLLFKPFDKHGNVHFKVCSLFFLVKLFDLRHLLRLTVISNPSLL